MSADDIQATLHALVTDARNYQEAELTPARAEATRRYNGELFGNEEEGRSQYVATVTRDTVGTFLANLLRVFFSSDRAVEFTPRRVDTVEQAEQATEYISDVVIAQDNPGYQIFHDAFQDALVRKVGIFKWWHEPEVRQAYAAVGVSAEAVAVLQQDPDVQIERASPSIIPTMYDIEYSQLRSEGVSRFVAIPPEEWLISRDARDGRTATFVGHQTRKTRSELLAMGVSEADIDEYGQDDTTLSENPEEIERRGGQIEMPTTVPDRSNDKSLFIEGFPIISMDGKNAELRRVTMLGPAYHVLTNEPWDERPFGLLCPYPEAHVAIGKSLADRTQDLDALESKIVRAMLDSLALSLHPRIGFVEGEVDLSDVMNTDIGAPIRMRQPNALQPIEHAFVGQAAFPVLEYVRDILENRTGRTKAAEGLDPDTLQSSTRTGVAATLSAAQLHVEVVARQFAETGVKDLMRGLLRLEAQYPKRKRVTRLRGKYVEVDPRSWDVGMDVKVNVALGSGLAEAKVALLAGIAGKQEMILQTMGRANPLVTLKQYRDTLVKGIRAAGRADAETFFQDVDPNWQPPPQEPAPDPNMVIAQAEVERAKADVAKKGAEVEREKLEFERESLKTEADVQLRREEMHLRDDRERDKLEADLMLEAKKLELEHGVKVDLANIQAAIARERIHVDAGTRVTTAKIAADAQPKPGAST